MRKFVLPILLLILGLVIFAACGNDDHEIVGTWIWNDCPNIPPSTPITFNSNGTGNRDWFSGFLGGAPEHFDWTINGNHLVIDITRGFAIDAGFATRENWTVNISGNSMTISSLDEPGLIYFYTRN
ncbi:MAG: hypothetical protein LBE35_03750 [Clostridiales bacterium]|jgi:hypothetical protein|nr:hypothetical protein [Clostridiales bacterium]